MLKVTLHDCFKLEQILKKAKAEVAAAAETFVEFVSWEELWMWLMRAKRDLFVRGVKKGFRTEKIFKKQLKIAPPRDLGG